MVGVVKWVVVARGGWGCVCVWVSVCVCMYVCVCVCVCMSVVGFFVVRRALPQSLHTHAHTHTHTHTYTPTQNADSCCRRIHDNNCFNREEREGEWGR